MGPTAAQSPDSGLYDIGWSVEVGFANFQMNDFPALAFQGSRLVQDFKGSLGAEPRHALGQSKFMLCGLIHGARSASLYSPGFGAPAKGIPLCTAYGKPEG